MVAAFNFQILAVALLAVASANAFFSTPYAYPAAHVSSTRAGGNFAYAVNGYPHYYGYPVAAFPAVKPVEVKEVKPAELKTAPLAYPYAAYPYAAYPYAAYPYAYHYAYPFAAPVAAPAAAPVAAAEKPAEDMPAKAEAEPAVVEA